MANLLFEKLSQSLNGNQEWRLGLAGDFFRLSDASYPVTVSLVKENRIVGSMANIQSGDYVRDIEFDAVIIKNGSTSQIVTVQVAGGGAGSDRIVGEVSVINGEISRVQNGQCFIGKCIVSAAAGQYSTAQMWNPAGSGKKIVITKISMASVSVATVISLNADTVILPGGVDGNIMNKNLGGPAAVARILSATLAVINPAPANIYIEQASKTVDYPFAEPILINPGYGLNINSVAQNNAISCTLQWNEV